MTKSFNILRLAAFAAGLLIAFSMRTGAVPLLVLQESGKEKKSEASPQDKPKPVPPIRPGKDRWLIKTASDKEAGAVEQKPITSTIEDLLKIPRPMELGIFETPAEFQEKRVNGTEKTVYSIEADIVECQLMQDGDYRVVLRGASGESIVMEMPDPAFVDQSSPFYYAIKSARDKFASRTKPERDKKTVIGHAKITGIGFFGRAYNKANPPKGNLIQLHPVLDFGWQETASKDFQERAEAAKKAKAETEHKDVGNNKP